MEEIKQKDSEKKKRGRPSYRTLPFLCRVCEGNVFPENKAYYSTYYSLVSAKAKKLNVFARIKGLFGVLEEHEADGSYIVCKMCFRKMERYEATFKELTSIRDIYQSNVARWKNQGLIRNEARSQRTKACTSDHELPGASIDEGRSRSSPCTDGEKTSLDSSIKPNSETSLDETTATGNRANNPLQSQMTNETGSCFQTAEAITTLHRKKRGRPSQTNSSPFCRVCATKVLTIRGYYCGYYNLFSAKSMEQNLFSRITGLFGDEDDDKSLGPHFVCKKCLRKVERYEACFKELISLREAYQKNLARWRNRVQSSQKSPPSPVSSPGDSDSLTSTVKLSVSERSTASTEQAAQYVLENENVKQSIDYAKAQKRRSDMASASSSTDQTQKETAPVSPAMSHSPAGENHVTTAINSNTQNSATAFPISVKCSLESANLRPKALVFPSGIAFDYENFPKLVSICWPVITDLSGNKVIVRDGPTRESVSSNDAVVPSSCLSTRDGASSFSWGKPENKPGAPFINSPVGSSYNNTKVQNDNSDAFPTNTSSPLRIPTLAQPCECPIHTQGMCNGPRLQHVEISAQILLSENSANYNNNDDATVPVMKNQSYPSESNSNHEALCLPHYVTGSLSQTREKEPVFGQVLVSPDSKHPGSNPAIIRKILPVKQPLRVKPLHVSFCLRSDPKPAVVGGLPTSTTDQEVKEIPCSINCSDKQTSNTQAARNNEMQESIEESELTMKDPCESLKCKRAMDDVTIENMDGPSEVTNAKTLKPSDESFVFYSPSEDEYQFVQQSRENEHPSIGSSVHSATIPQQNVGFSNKQENVRDLISRIRCIKSKLHRAECEQRKKQMLKNILVLQKRVKALTKGMRKGKVDPVKIDEQTGDSANNDKSISSQESPEVSCVQSNSNGTNVETEVGPVVSDETETINEERETAKSELPFLPDRHQQNPKVATQKNCLNGDELIIPLVDIQLNTSNEAGTNEPQDMGELKPSAFNSADNAENQEFGGSNLGKDDDSDVTRKEFIVTLPSGTRLASSSETLRKRSFPSFNVDEYSFQGSECAVASKKIKRLSPFGNEAPEVCYSFQDVLHRSKNVTEDRISEHLTPVDKDNVNGDMKHDKTSVTENGITVMYEGNRKGAYSCWGNNVKYDSRGVTQSAALESLVLNDVSELKGCSRDFDKDSSQREIFNVALIKETDSYASALCKRKGNCVEKEDSAGILAENLAPIEDEENLTKQRTINVCEGDELGETSNLFLGSEILSHNVQIVTQDAENGTSLIVTRTNATPNKIADEESVTTASHHPQRETRLVPSHSKDTQIFREEENTFPDYSVQGQEDPNAINIDEAGPPRLVLVDRLLDEGVAGKVYEFDESVEQGHAGAAVEISNIFGSMNNRIEEIVREEEQTRLIGHKPFSEETQGISSAFDRASPLVRDNNDNELFSFSLQRVVKEEETQELTSPSVHNSTESSEEIDLMQSIQIRRARILNLTEKRDRLLNLAGLRTNRL